MNEMSKSKTKSKQKVIFNSKDRGTLIKASMVHVVKDLEPFLAVKGDGFDAVVTAGNNLGVQKEMHVNHYVKEEHCVMIQQYQEKYVMNGHY